MVELFRFICIVQRPTMFTGKFVIGIFYTKINPQNEQHEFFRCVLHDKVTFDCVFLLHPNLFVPKHYDNAVYTHTLYVNNALKCMFRTTTRISFYSAQKVPIDIWMRILQRHLCSFLPSCTGNLFKVCRLQRLLLVNSMNK